MKNALNYFYNIIVDDIHQNSKMYYFDYYNLRYALVAYRGDVQALNDIYNLHLEALKRGINVHQIVLNKDGQVATLINGIPYILMALYHGDEEITFNELALFFGTTYDGNISIDRTDWGMLWANKVDYLEYEISQLGQKYHDVRDTFSYFVGMAETGIQLVNLVNVVDDKGRSSSSKTMAMKTISHDRIRTDDTLFDLYNPLNLVIDYRVRDMAEYFKHRHYDGFEINDELNYFLMYSGMSRDEYLLFFARMLYPTYYFDLYEDIISGEKSEDELKKIINRVNDYEQLIKNIYRYYKNFLNMIPIEWLESS